MRDRWSTRRRRWRRKDTVRARGCSSKARQLPREFVQFRSGRVSFLSFRLWFLLPSCIFPFVYVGFYLCLCSVHLLFLPFTTSCFRPFAPSCNVRTLFPLSSINDPLPFSLFSSYYNPSSLRCYHLSSLTSLCRFLCF